MLQPEDTKEAEKEEEKGAFCNVQRCKTS